MSQRKYIPALRFHWLTPFYDKLLLLTFPERKIKELLVSELKLNGNEVILDFGSGTGTLSIMIKKSYPLIDLTGVDVDEKIILTAHNKSQAAGLSIPFKIFDGDDLSSFQSGHFDKVISSLVFHHLGTSAKRKILLELLRLLKPGGLLLIADFGKPKTVIGKIGFGLLRRFDGMENTAINAKGLLPSFVTEAGFEKVKETRYVNTVFGTVSILKSYKPDK